MVSDSELLRRYSDEGDQQAFAEIVRRHLDLVYAAAAHHLGGRTHADEVCQGVFIALARKSRSLMRRDDLVGWLYQSARYAALDKVRSEARRRARELAFAEEPMNAPHGDGPSDEVSLKAFLFEALAGLRQRERSALLLRYWENRSWEEIGAALSVSAESARKRTERALDRLRTRLRRRGIASSGAALGAALSVSLVAAPAESAPVIAATAVAAVAAPIAAWAALLAFMVTSKAILVAAVVAAAVSVGLAVHESGEARTTAEWLARAERQRTAAAAAAESARLHLAQASRRVHEVQPVAKAPVSSPRIERVTKETGEYMRGSPRVVALAQEEHRRYYADTYRPFIASRHLPPEKAEHLLDLLAAQSPVNALGFSMPGDLGSSADNRQRELEALLGPEGLEALASFEAEVVPSNELVNLALGKMLANDPSFGAKSAAIASLLRTADAQGRANLDAGTSGVLYYAARTDAMLDAAGPGIEALLTPEQRVTFHMAYKASTGHPYPRP